MYPPPTLDPSWTARTIGPVVSIAPYCAGADPEIFLRGGPESKLCKMKGIHS